MVCQAGNWSKFFEALPNKIFYSPAFVWRTLRPSRPTHEASPSYPQGTFLREILALLVCRAYGPIISFKFHRRMFFLSSVGFTESPLINVPIHTQVLAHPCGRNCREPNILGLSSTIEHLWSLSVLPTPSLMSKCGPTVCAPSDWCSWEVSTPSSRLPHPLKGNGATRRLELTSLSHPLEESHRLPRNTCLDCVVGELPLQ